MSDRRGEDRSEIKGLDLRITILSGDNTIRGRLLDLSPRGMQVEIPGILFAPVLARRRVIAVELCSGAQPVLHASLIVVYIVENSDAPSLLAGLRFIGTEARPVPEPPAETSGAAPSERRSHPRSACEFPAVLTVGGGDAARSLPVIVTNITETGCRVEGPSDLDYLLPGAMVQLTIEPWDMSPILMLAEVVSTLSARSVGLRFRKEPGCAQGRALDGLVTTLRYPDLVLAEEPHAEGIWATLSASGYFRERAPERYHRLHESAVDCWERLNSPAGRRVNRTLISEGDAGAIGSVCQLSRFYGHTWMAHHLAVLGEIEDRNRLAPQQFGGVFDTLLAIGARHFINYHNAAHTAQNRIWLRFAERNPPTEFSIRSLVCFELLTDDEKARRVGPREIRVRQVGDESADALLPMLRECYTSLVFDAMGFEDDLMLERLDRDYQRVKLERRRCWLLAESADAKAMGFASLEVVPTGFNLTSIGDHVLLHPLVSNAPPAEAAASVRQLVRHATLYFGRLGKPYVIIMAEARWEDLLRRALGIEPMARAHELVMARRLFGRARDFIRGLYRERSGPSG